MSKIRVVIVDDEPIAIEVIKELIAHLTNDLTVIGVARNGLEALEKIPELKPDLVFMDVDMPLMNGHEALEKLAYRPSYVIFTTGYGSQPVKAIQGTKVSTIAKPIDPSDFLALVGQVRLHLNTFS
jgi:two-component system LytT family response regulator